jgi:outer membrane receptor for ferrienterochelin and colicin
MNPSFELFAYVYANYFCNQFNCEVLKSKVRTIAVFLSIVLCISTMNAGAIRGTVRAKGTNEPIAGVNVSLPGTGMGAVTNASGEFFVSMFAGTYKMRVSILGYEHYEINNVVLPDDTSEVFLDVFLKESPVSVADVVIRGRANRELESSSRLAEKQANNVINVVGAQTIERSTDRTIADVLGRVSGLSLVRDQNGEGRYVVMRGLEQQYNNTTLDGIKIPSPESRNRFVPLDIFPSGLFERVEVTKALTPELAGDAIGGSTNLMMREAPDKLTFTMSIASGSMSGVYGKNFDTFNKGAVQELDPDRLHGRVSDSDPTNQLGPRYNPTSTDFPVQTMKFTNSHPPLDGLYTFLLGNRFFDNRLGFIAAGSYQNTYSTVQTDLYSVGADINNVDANGFYKIYPSTYDKRVFYINKIREGATVKGDFIFDTDQQMYVSYLYVRQEENQVRHGLQINIDNSRGSADLTGTHLSAYRVQTENSFSVGGNHFTSSPFAIRWILNTTDALQDRPDEASYTTLQNYDPYGNIQPFQGLGGIYYVWRKNDDKQLLGKVDFTIRLTSDGSNTIQIGVNAQKLNRVNFQNDYKLNPKIINGSTQAFTTIDSAKTVVFGYGSTSGTSVYGYQNYKSQEKLISSYFQYIMIVGDLQILAGVRWEQANDTYFTMVSPQVGGSTNDVTTVDFLPGIHFRYTVTSNQVARLSLTRTMSRPSYFDLVPAVERSDNNQSQGNPNLRPALATNLDLRYEYYPNQLDLISLGLYAKRITGPIQDMYFESGISSRSKGNGDPASVYGIEAAVVKKIGNFGISANYTYAYSVVTNMKLVQRLDPYGDQANFMVQQTRPLQSQAPHILNLTLSYLNSDWGTDFNVSYNYTGRRLIIVSQSDGYDTYEDGYGALDFSGEQSLFFGIKLTVKLINLLNSEKVQEIASGDYTKHDPIIIERDINKFRGTIGLSFKL